MSLMFAIKKTAILSLALISLTGCQSTYNQKSLGSPTTTGLDILTAESQKAVLAQKSFQTQQFSYQKSLQTKQLKFTVDVLNVDYIGTPEVLLASIANNFGYRYLENGPARTLPIVNFTNRKETGFEVVKDVAVFIDGYASITIDNQNKTILLTYLSN